MFGVQKVQNTVKAEICLSLVNNSDVSHKHYETIVNHHIGEQPIISKYRKVKKSETTEKCNKSIILSNFIHHLSLTWLHALDVTVE